MAQSNGCGTTPRVPKMKAAGGDVNGELEPSQQCIHLLEDCCATKHVLNAAVLDVVPNAPGRPSPHPEERLLLSLDAAVGLALAGRTSREACCLKSKNALPWRSFSAAS